MLNFLIFLRLFTLPGKRKDIPFVHPVNTDERSRIVGPPVHLLGCTFISSALVVRHLNMRVQA